MDNISTSFSKYQMDLCSAKCIEKVHHFLTPGEIDCLSR